MLSLEATAKWEGELIPSVEAHAKTAVSHTDPTAVEELDRDATKGSSRVTLGAASSIA